jgi:hypothetical protein
MAARLLLLAPPLASAMLAYQDVRGRPNALSVDPQPSALSERRVDRSSEAGCLGRGEGTDEEFLRQCPVCRIFGYGEDVPRIYIKEGVDGLGSRVYDIIASMAVAARMQMALGGVIYGKRTKHCSHGLDIPQGVGAFFGIKDYSLMFTNDSPHMNATFPTFGAFEKAMKKFGRPQGGNIFITNVCMACEVDNTHRLSEFYTPKFLSELREGFVWRQPLVFKPSSMSIAIHVRRGDVADAGGMDEAQNWRITSDQWYFSLMKHLKWHWPGADMHVFSSLEGRWQDSDFDSYRQKGATVHLDGDTTEVWAHFSSADVLVMAKSSFSHVPAFVNPNCVIYQPYMHQPLDGWVVAQADDKVPLSKAAEKELKSCIESKAQSAGRT